MPEPSRQLQQTFAELQADLNAFDASKGKGSSTQPVYIDQNGVAQPCSSEFIPVDSAMSDTSSNAVQNKVIKQYVDEKEPDLTNYYTKQQTDAKVAAEKSRAQAAEAGKAPLNHTHAISDVNNLQSASTLVLSADCRLFTSLIA